MRKILVQIIFITFTFLSSLQLLSAAQPQKMPSVEDMFAGMSEDEIAEQVAQAQQFFDQLSPEEMEQLKGLVEQTLNEMTPEDLEAIEAISKLPAVAKIGEDQERKEVEKANKKEDAPTKPSVATQKTEVSDELKNIISSLHKEIDQILQKAESSKDLLATIKEWSSKTTFENMRRRIFALKENRNLKNLLADKDEQLTKMIKEFYKEVASLNKQFSVEDNFGMTVSKEQEAIYSKKFKQILSQFEDYIDRLMPELEKFFRKHDPELLQLEKEAQEREKSAKAHASDSLVRRGSAPAQVRPEQNVPQAQAGVQPGGRYYDNSRDYYPQQRSAYNPQAPSQNIPTAQSAPKTPQQSDAKKSDQAKNTKKSENPEYDATISDLADHLDEYNNNHEKRVINFFKNDLSTYPDATVPQRPASTDEENEWFASQRKYSNHGFANYSKKINDFVSKTLLEEMRKTQLLIDTTHKNVSKISKDNLKKLASSKELKSLKNRVSNYTALYDQAMSQVDSMFRGNVGALIHNVPNKYKTQYHDPFIKDLDMKVKDPLNIMSNSLKKLDAKIKREQNKSKSK